MGRGGLRRTHRRRPGRGHPRSPRTCSSSMRRARGRQRNLFHGRRDNLRNLLPGTGKQPSSCWPKGHCVCKSGVARTASYDVNSVSCWFGWSTPKAGWPPRVESPEQPQWYAGQLTPAHASSHTRTRQSTRVSTCTPPVSSSPQERIVHRAPPSSSPGLHSRHRTHTDRRWRSPSCRTPCKAAR